MTVRTFGVSPPDGHIFLTPPNLPWNPTRAIYIQSTNTFSGPNVFSCKEVQGLEAAAAKTLQELEVQRFGSSGLVVEDGKINKGLGLPLIFQVPVR